VSQVAIPHQGKVTTAGFQRWHQEVPLASEVGDQEARCLLWHTLQPGETRPGVTLVALWNDEGNLRSFFP